MGFEILIESLVGMFTSPDETFKRASNSEISLVIPVILLLVIGVLLGAVIMRELPAKEESLRQSGRTLTHNIEPQIKAEKAKASFFPIFILLFWVLFNIAFSIIITKMNGMGEISGIFKCTSLLVYPFFVAILLKLIVSFVPFLGFLYSLVMLAVSIWTLFALWKIAVAVGQLAPMDGAVAAGVPAFFFMLFWMSYGLIVDLFVYRFAG